MSHPQEEVDHKKILRSGKTINETSLELTVERKNDDEDDSDQGTASKADTNKVTTSPSVISRSSYSFPEIQNLKTENRPNRSSHPSITSNASPNVQPSFSIVGLIDIPDDVLRLVLSFSLAKEVINFGLTSSSNYEFSGAELIWERLCITDFEVFRYEIVSRTDPNDRQQFRTNHSRVIRFQNHEAIRTHLDINSPRSLRDNRIPRRAENGSTTGAHNVASTAVYVRKNMFCFKNLYKSKMHAFRTREASRIAHEKDRAAHAALLAKRPNAELFLICFMVRIPWMLAVLGLEMSIMLWNVYMQGNPVMYVTPWIIVSPLLVVLIFLATNCMFDVFLFKKTKDPRSVWFKVWAGHESFLASLCSVYSSDFKMAAFAGFTLLTTCFIELILIAINTTPGSRLFSWFAVFAPVWLLLCAGIYSQSFKVHTSDTSTQNGKETKETAALHLAWLVPITLYLIVLCLYFDGVLTNLPLVLIPLWLLDFIGLFGMLGFVIYRYCDNAEEADERRREDDENCTMGCVFLWIFGVPLVAFEVMLCMYVSSPTYNRPFSTNQLFIPLHILGVLCILFGTCAATCTEFVFDEHDGDRYKTPPKLPVVNHNRNSTEDGNVPGSSNTASSSTSASAAAAVAPSSTTASSTTTAPVIVSSNTSSNTGIQASSSSNSNDNTSICFSGGWCCSASSVTSGVSTPPCPVTTSGASTLVSTTTSNISTTSNQTLYISPEFAGNLSFEESMAFALDLSASEQPQPLVAVEEKEEDPMMIV